MNKNQGIKDNQVWNDIGVSIGDRSCRISNPERTGLLI
jgi:hypothetical protein